jgi:uncharacterized protein (TIGR02145 family)/prepilin-type N-terminal cleavage/methylation domain-containing protein
MKKTGFTLVEILVAVVIFSLLISVFAGFFFTAIRSQKKSLADQELIGNVSYNLEYMSRSIRMAKKDIEGIGCLIDPDQNYQLTRAGQGIKFLRHDNVCQEFYLENNVLYEEKVLPNEPLAITLPLTPQYLEITRFIIEINDFEPGQAQPNVSLLLEIKDLEIQTTISQRNLNLYDSGGGSGGSTPWSCGDNVIFTYKGSTVTYGTVINSATGKCWLDRNLGASQQATAFNDSNAYGDLFQWGRLDDEHQTRTSNITSTLSYADNPGHDMFILDSNISPYDWRSPQNDDLWQGVDGTNNPCPSGWRLPTETEWQAERATWSSNNYNGAYASPLKLTAAGGRGRSTGSLDAVGTSGHYWSSTSDGTTSRRLSFGSTGAGMYSHNRANGLAVRCLKD